jgi:hypothetical protein
MEYILLLLWIEVDHNYCMLHILVQQLEISCRKTAMPIKKLLFQLFKRAIISTKVDVLPVRNMRKTQNSLSKIDHHRTMFASDKDPVEARKYGNVGCVRRYSSTRRAVGTIGGRYIPFGTRTGTTSNPFRDTPIYCKKPGCIVVNMTCSREVVTHLKTFAG